MKGRKTAVLPGIVMAAIEFEDDDEKLGAEVKMYLERGGYIRKGVDGKYEAC